jgi:hypothetical protein
VNERDWDPWFVGAWRRRSITVPGGEPVEPCEAWWIQAGEAFVDIRVTLPGSEHNGLPYSSTRAFAGRFEIVDGEVRWHVDLDSEGVAPRTDRAGAGGLFMSPDEAMVMIEDAPGRFREEWVQCASSHNETGPDVEFVRSDNLVAVRIGDISGVVLSVGGQVAGRVWHTAGEIAVGELRA